jgi:hypothetical protein
MKSLLLSLILIASPMAYSADCYWAVSLSCQQDQVTQFNNIDVVVSANFEKGKNSCPDSVTVGLDTAYMLQDKQLIGKVCETNQAQELFHDGDSFGIFAIGSGSSSSNNPLADAVSRAQQSNKRCLDATYTNRCMIVDEYAPISIQSYLAPAE